MARKQVRLDPAKIEAEARAAEEATKAAEAPPEPPPVVIVPDAPPGSVPEPPDKAPPVPAVATPPAEAATPPPPAPKAPAAPRKRYRVTEDRRFALYGMTMHWRAGRMLDPNGYDIAHLRAIGVKMEEV